MAPLALSTPSVALRGSLRRDAPLRRGAPVRALAAAPLRRSAPRRLRATATDDDRCAVIGGERWLTHAPLAYFALDKLAAKGLRANADVGSPNDSSRPLLKLGDVAVGSWACTTGGWESPSPRASTEVFYVLKGEGSVDDEDGTRHRFGAGDLVTLPRGWSGRWDVTSTETLHKVWVTHAHPEVSGASTAAVVTTPIAPAQTSGWFKRDVASGPSHKVAYNVGGTSVSVWSAPPGTKQQQADPTIQALHVLDGVAFVTNADGTAYRCAAGDTLVLPAGWSGSWDIVEELKAVSVAVGDGTAAPGISASAASTSQSKARRPIVGGNWKCNPESFDDLPGLIANINACDTTHCDVYVCPSNLHVGAVYNSFTNGALVAPQNCNFKGTGAFTGEMAVEQMKSMGMKWVLIGHSERRGEFGLPTPAESNALLATKLEHILDQGLNCILAIGEPLPVREKGIDAVMENLIPQLAEVKDLLSPERVVIAYEPVWSIGTGVTATPAQAQETHAAIRQWIRENVSDSCADGIRIQYGGSANASNAPELAACPDVDGFLVGGASLKPEFKDIVAALVPEETRLAAERQKLEKAM